MTHLHPSHAHPFDGPRPARRPGGRLDDRPSGRFGRRSFLLGAAAAGVLAACGDGDDGSTGDAGGGSGDGPYTIIQRYPSGVQVPGEVRLPFSLSTGSATFITDGPELLRARVLDIDGNPVVDETTAVRRTTTPGDYYDFRVDIAEPGIYSIVIENGPPEGANFQIFDPRGVVVPPPGQPLAGFDTPTERDPGGVDPICTREPACEFHAVTLTEALAAGTPVAYMVGTPAFCQTGSCTPSLEALITVAPEFQGALAVVHAEVYTDLTATEVTPAVQALGLSFEPVLFLTAADGTIVERLDGLWDETELRERLTLLTA